MWDSKTPQSPMCVLLRALQGVVNSLAAVVSRLAPTRACSDIVMKINVFARSPLPPAR